MRDDPHLEVCFSGEGGRLGKKLRARREVGWGVALDAQLADITDLSKIGSVEFLYDNKKQ